MIFSVLSRVKALFFSKAVYFCCLIISCSLFYINNASAQNSNDYSRIGVFPAYSFKDAANVDLLSGQFSQSVADLSIGSGLGMLSHVTLGEGNQLGLFGAWIHDNFEFNMNPSVSLKVGTDEGSDSFYILNGNIIPFDNKGGKLEKISNTGYGYRYTTNNSVVYNHPGDYLTDYTISYPNGLIKTVYYRTITHHANLQSKVPSDVVINTGYQMHYDYDSLGTISKITAFNTSIDYCPPGTSVCNFSRPWPSSSYYTNVDVNVPYSSLPNTRVSRITDQYQRQYNYSLSFGFAGLTTPESTISNNISYSICEITVNSSPSEPCNRSIYGASQGVTDRIGRIASANVNGVTYNYSYALGVPYTTETISHSPTGTYKRLHGITGCQTLDPCYDFFIDEDGKDYRFNYMDHSKLTSVTYDINIKDDFSYDSRRNLTQVVRTPNAASGLSAINVSTNYDTACNNYVTCNKPNYKLDAKGNRTDYTYDPIHGGVLTETGPADVNGIRPQTRNTYTQLYPKVKNANGQLVNSTPIYMLTRQSTCRSSTNNCTGTADETVTIYKYEDNNLNLTSKTIAAGNADFNQPNSFSNLYETISYVYDAVGNILSEDGPLAGDVDKVYHIYNSIGLKVGDIGIDPDGTGPLKRSATRYTYNSAAQIINEEIGSVTGTTDAEWVNFSLSSSKQTTYDGYGRPSIIKTVSSGSTYNLLQISYDQYGRKQCEAVRMNPATYNSLPSSACILGTSGSFGPDRITKYQYDALNRVTEIDRGVGASNQIYARYSYTNLGLKTSETDANGNKTSLIYDGFDRLSQVQYPSATNIGASNPSDYEAFSYDNNGNRTSWRRRNGYTINYAYDALNREIYQDVPVSPGNSNGVNLDLSTSYDLTGKVLTRTLGNGQTSNYQYDGLNRLSYNSDIFGRQQWKYYNQASALWVHNYSPSSYVAYNRDNSNRITGAYVDNGEVVYNQSFDDLGRRISINKGSSNITSFGYDLVSRLASMTNDLGGTSSDIAYTFGYTPANQISNIQSSNSAYDYVGSTAISINRSYNGLNQDTGYGHDANGNLTSDGSRTMTYDVFNRLISVTGSGINLSLEYDPEGRLAKTTSNGAVNTFQYDGSNLIAEYDGAGSMMRRYIHGSGVDEPLVWFEGSGYTNKKYFVQNYQGSVIGYTDAYGNLAETYKYSEYGEPTNASNNQYWGGARFRYTGQTMLGDAKLYYYKARIYDPVMGRFLQTDPIGAKDDLDLYAYVGGDPVNKTDPLGLWPLVNSAGEEVKHRTSERQAEVDKENKILGNALKVVIGGNLVGRVINTAVALSPVKNITESVPNVPKSNNTQHSPNFVVTSNGTVIPVPNGATGPMQTRASGMQFTGGNGNNSSILNNRVTGVRIMDANSNQGARAVYMNNSGQTVSPTTGRTVPNSSPEAHHYFGN